MLLKLIWNNDDSDNDDIMMVMMIMIIVLIIIIMPQILSHPKRKDDIFLQIYHTLQSYSYQNSVLLSKVSGIKTDSQTGGRELRA